MKIIISEQQLKYIIEENINHRDIHLHKSHTEKEIHNFIQKFFWSGGNVEKLYDDWKDFDLSENGYDHNSIHFLNWLKWKFPNYWKPNQIDENTELTELYLEGNYPPLYHSTPSQLIPHILKSDTLIKSTPYKGVKCVCLTRSQLYTVDGRKQPRLKLDQNKLRIDGYIPKPIDEFGDEPNSQNRKYKINNISKNSNTEWEFEERIYKDIPNLHKYLIAIQIPHTDRLSDHHMDDYGNPVEAPYIQTIRDYIKLYPHIKLEAYATQERWKTLNVNEETELNELTQYKEGNLHLLYRDNILSVVVPNSPEASTVSCKGTKWCTKDPYMFHDVSKHNIMFRFLFHNHYKLRLTWDYDGGEFSWGSGGNIYKEIRGYGNPFQTKSLLNDVKKGYEEIINRDFYRREKDKVIHNDETNSNMTRAQYYKLILNTKLDMIKRIELIPKPAIDKVLHFHQQLKRK